MRKFHHPTYAAAGARPSEMLAVIFTFCRCCLCFASPLRQGVKADCLSSAWVQIQPPAADDGSYLAGTRDLGPAPLHEQWSQSIQASGGELAAAGVSLQPWAHTSCALARQVGHTRAQAAAAGQAAAALTLPESVPEDEQIPNLFALPHSQLEAPSQVTTRNQAALLARLAKVASSLAKAKDAHARAHARAEHEAHQRRAEAEQAATSSEAAAQLALTLAADLQQTKDTLTRMDRNVRAVSEVGRNKAILGVVFFSRS
jgi:hypothetical protein